MTVAGPLLDLLPGATLGQGVRSCWGVVLGWRGPGTVQREGQAARRGAGPERPWKKGWASPLQG